MVTSRWLLVSSVLCGVMGTAQAQPKQTLPAMVGANELMKVTTPSGFVDDVVAYDNQRLAYVVADTSTKAELHVVQFGCAKCIEDKQEIVIDLAAVTLRPTSLRLVGQRAFVIGATEDGNQIAALIDFAKKAPLYKLGPATHVTLITRDSKPVVAVHKASATKVGTKHDVELFALENGKRVAKGKAFELDKDTEKKLDFRVNHWSDGWTRAGGLKGGDWNKKENQRSPDSEATYDLIAGKFVENKPIGDLFEQRKRYQILADAGGQLDFFRMKPDNTAIEIWRKGALGAITLDQPLSQYDVKSLQGIIQPDGSAWIAIKVDPVNAEAVARKKADPEYLDVFRVGTDGKATRKARILAKGVKHRFGVVDNYFWLLERSTGFDRGGRVLTVYQISA
ncbi:MAG TPA: hypothetical protein VFV99_14665 [Kofleriaceae bacterium]|nr:hypothetical protein [Kofleriaceae bacterium]